MPAQDIDPRYLSYDKDEVEDLLEKVENPDTSPTEDSDRLITSGAVFAALAQIDDIEGGFYY